MATLQKSKFDHFIAFFHENGVQRQREDRLKYLIKLFSFPRFSLIVEFWMRFEKVFFLYQYPFRAR